MASMLSFSLGERSDLSVLGKRGRAVNKPKYFIGCWAQPPESFAKWKNDGVNVIIGPDKGNPVRFTQLEIHTKIKALDLLYIDTPSSLQDLERMVADPSCYAISLPDEPDLYLPPYNSDPIGFQKAVDLWMAKNKWIAEKTARRKKLYINFAGPKVTGGITSGYAGQMQKPFAELTGPGDILSHDWYPANMQRLRYLDTYPSIGIQCLKKWFPNREYWAFLECSDQLLDKTAVVGDPKNQGRAPTHGEMEGQLRAVLVENVSGIAWFSHQFQGQPWDVNGAAGKTAWDGRTPELLAKTREIAVRLNGTVVDTPEVPKPNPEIAEMKSRIDQLEYHEKEILKEIETIKKNAVLDVTVSRGL